MDYDYGEWDGHGPAVLSLGISRLHGAECPKCQCRFVYNCTGRIECYDCGHFVSLPEGAHGMYEYAYGDLLPTPLELGETAETFSMQDYADCNAHAEEQLDQIQKEWGCYIRPNTWMPTQSQVDDLNAKLLKRTVQ